jgi:hypothetical protein
MVERELRKAKRRFWVRRPCGTQLVPSPKLPLPTLRLAELVLGLDRRRDRSGNGPLFQRERRYRDTPLRFYGHTAECVEWVGLHETARVHPGQAMWASHIPHSTGQIYQYHRADSIVSTIQIPASSYPSVTVNQHRSLR